MIPTRRDFVRTALAAPFLAAGLRAEEPTRSGFSGLIVRAHQPRNLEFPLSELKDRIVPNEQFFVRSHFAEPDVDVKAWKRVYFNGEARYLWSNADLGLDFSGFKPMDLAGFRVTGGIRYMF